MSSSSTQNPTTNTTNLQPTAKATSMEVDEQAKERGESRQSIWGPLRLRGGGLAKDCLIGFVCFEVCEGCCDCIGDILCCPCDVVLDCCCN
ncbi:hypothetical protein BS47DRAFT_1342695 [Hydnum rufescens UP504]|uniref:Uncharacterized protein n=1 Tax=Hydnum rufescens UP504 TaxID=1448309 RepID=A0A9P6DYA6_9AGAM|nr:hypothetical protein BS47DRAFT_1342695 [Hydnum rufescens UP504]